MLQAILWDVDGTLAETERDGHLVAFNAAFAELDLPWRWTDQRYGELLRVAGGYERLLFDMASQPAAPVGERERRALAERIHRLKNARYAALVASGAVPLRPGVRELFDDCAAAGVRMAIATTTSRGNVAALLSVQLGDQWERRFAAVVCAEDAPSKKPDPQVYRIALHRLNVAAHESVAIEDSPAGLEAAHAAGIPVVIVRSRYFTDDPVPQAMAVGPGLESTADWQPPPIERERIGLASIATWHAAGIGRGQLSPVS